MVKTVFRSGSYLLFMLLVLWASSTPADTVARWIKITNTTPEVYLGDTLLLEIESTGLRDPIDLGVLDKVGRFTRETTGTRIAVINQKVVEIAIRRMEFEPEELGTHVVGPLRAGEIVSNSVFVNVLPPVDNNWQPDSNDLKINVSLSRDKPWIHSRIQLDVILRHRYPVAEESVELPTLRGFIVRTVHSERRIFSDDTRQWRQTSWRYLLFPSTSGPVQIGPVTWSGTLIKSRTERADFIRENPQITLNILPSPTAGADWWLPARALSVDETWSKPAISLKAGDEVTRTITINAFGTLAAQLPEPKILASRALEQTLVNTHREERIVDNDIQSEARFTYRVRAQSPIPVFLDTLRVPWWNTETQTNEEAIIPARRINVGLPERADLLRDLALGSTRIGIFKEWLRDQSWLHVLALIAITGVAAALLSTFYSAMKSGVIHAINRHKTKRSLHKQNQRNNLSGLYNKTSQLLRTGEISNADDLLVELRPLLFDPSCNQANSCEIQTRTRFTRLIDAVVVNKPTQMQKKQNHLAPL